MQSVRLSIHSNGGYDVVLVGKGDVEGEMLEFNDLASNPFELEALTAKYVAAGAAVVDYRTPEKLALAKAAKDAVNWLAELVSLSAQGGVDPEAIAKSRLYAIAATRAATETSC